MSLIIIHAMRSPTLSQIRELRWFAFTDPKLNTSSRKIQANIKSAACSTDRQARDLQSSTTSPHTQRRYRWSKAIARPLLPEAQSIQLSESFLEWGPILRFRTSLWWSQVTLAPPNRLRLLKFPRLASNRTSRGASECTGRSFKGLWSPPGNLIPGRIAQGKL